MLAPEAHATPAQADPHTMDLAVPRIAVLAGRATQEREAQNIEVQAAQRTQGQLVLDTMAQVDPRIEGREGLRMTVPVVRATPVQADLAIPAQAVPAQSALPFAGSSRLVSNVVGPNPSIERTVTSGLRPLVTAAHVKR